MSENTSSPANIDNELYVKHASQGMTDKCLARVLGVSTAELREHRAEFGIRSSYMAKRDWMEGKLFRLSRTTVYYRLNIAHVADALGTTPPTLNRMFKATQYRKPVDVRKELAPQLKGHVRKGTTADQMLRGTAEDRAEAHESAIKFVIR